MKDVPLSNNASARGPGFLHWMTFLNTSGAIFIGSTPVAYGVITLSM